MSDPKYPDRPDHPDFWLMSEAIIDLDTASENDVPFQEIIGDIDLKSLGYAAQQRALLAYPVSRKEQVAGVWLDGFMAGARFHELKRKRQAK